MENPCGGCGRAGSHHCPFRWVLGVSSTAGQPVEMAAGEAQMTQTFEKLAAVIQVPT